MDETAGPRLKCRIPCLEIMGTYNYGFTTLSVSRKLLVESQNHREIICPVGVPVGAKYPVRLHVPLAHSSQVLLKMVPSTWDERRYVVCRAARFPQIILMKTLKL
jgi:hypothetical protein